MEGAIYKYQNRNLDKRWGEREIFQLLLTVVAMIFRFSSFFHSLNLFFFHFLGFCFILFSPPSNAIVPTGWCCNDMQSCGPFFSARDCRIDTHNSARSLSLFQLFFFSFLFLLFHPLLPFFSYTNPSRTNEKCCWRAGTCSYNNHDKLFIIIIILPPSSTTGSI